MTQNQVYGQGAEENIEMTQNQVYGQGAEGNIKMTQNPVYGAVQSESGHEHENLAHTYEVITPQTQPTYEYIHI